MVIWYEGIIFWANLIFYLLSSIMIDWLINLCCVVAMWAAEDDVVFLFEEEPTEEQVARAQKWLLPRNFYLYEQRKPCSGCRGCTDDMGAPNAGKITLWL